MNFGQLKMYIDGELVPSVNNETKEIIPTLSMPFSLSYDHRVIDGAIGASFTSFFVNTVLEGSIFK